MLKKILYCNYSRDLLLYILSSTKFAIFVSSIIAPLLVAFIIYDYAPKIDIMIWLILNVAIYAFRVMVFIKLKKSITKNNNNEKLYFKLFVISTILPAFLMGMTALGSVMVDLPPVRLILIGALIVALTAGTIATLSTVYIAFLGFVLFSIVPFSITLFVEGGTIYLTFSLILLMYMIMLLSLGYKLFLNQRSMSDLKQKFKTIYDKSTDGIAIIDGREIVECNDATATMFGYKNTEEFLSKKLNTLMPKKQHDGSSSNRKMLEYLKKSKDTIVSFEWLHTKKDGSNFWVEITIQSVEINNKIVTQGIWRDIDARKKAQRSLHELTENLSDIIKEKTHEIESLHYYDSLTGLGNQFMCREDVEVKEGSYIILLDISSFSNFNKLLGKKFADEVLIQTANYLKMNLSTNMKLYKGDSDKYIVYAQNMTEDQTQEYCKKVNAFFDMQELIIEEQSFFVNFNMGIAPITHKVDVFIDVEFALASSKIIGAKTSYLYDSSKENIKEQKELLKWMKRSKEMIEDDLIVPYFQAIKNIETNRIYKYEVLARAMYHGEIIPPCKFLEPMKQLGLLRTLTRVIIDKSFAFFSNTDYEFSINLTQADLQDSSFLRFLRLKSARYGIDLHKVTFEVLENVSSSVLNEKTISDTFKGIKELGCLIAIDDFGIENSNLLRLLELDFDILKLDGVFIRNLANSKKSQNIVKGIIGLAQTMNIKTVAEFVESEVIYDIVKEIGIDYAQGYYIAKPEASLV